MRALLPLLILLLLSACSMRVRDWSSAPLEDLLEHQRQNFGAIESIEVSYRASLESARIGRVPFRLNVDYCADQIRLEIATPLGGRLLSLEGSATEATLSTGNSLPRALDLGLGALDDTGWQGALQNGLRRVLRQDDQLGAFRITYQSEEAAMILPLLDASITSLLADCQRSTLAPWLWGELLPGSGALVSSATEMPLSLCHTDTCWTLDAQSGLWGSMRLPGIELELARFSTQEGITLPKVIRLTRPEKKQRLILERRRLQLNRPQQTDSAVEK